MGVGVMIYWADETLVRQKPQGFLFPLAKREIFSYC